MDYSEFLKILEEELVSSDWKTVFKERLNKFKTKTEIDKRLIQINGDIDSPIGIYTSTTKSKQGVVDIRYKGQSIGISKGGNIEFSKTFDDYFNPELKSSMSDLNYFLENYKGKLVEEKKLHSPEHKFESFLLKTMKVNNKTGNGIELKFIKPVCVNDLFFQMPTFYKASNHEKIPQFSFKGGGIDILSRIQIKDMPPKKMNHLCVMELKDEIDKKGETPDLIIKQAITYAFCIYKLLKSDDGKDWYNFFRDKDDEKEIPNPLILYACVVAPFPKDKKIKSEYFITNDDITFPNSNDILKLRYLYLDMNEDFSEINEIETNLELREK